MPNIYLKSIKKRILGKLFLDIGSSKNIIFVAGPGRGGTTWLTSLIAKAFGYRQIFEPFWSLHLSADNIKDFFHHRFIPSDCSKYDDSIKFVLDAKYKTRSTFHVNHNFHPGPFHGRIIKDICSNLFLPRIHAVRPDMPIIYIMRHPCAVVASRIKTDQMNMQWGLHTYLFNEQKKFIDLYFKGETIKPKNQLEDHIISYCYENFIPHHFLKNEPYIYTIFYESLILDFQNQFNKLIEFIEEFSMQKHRKNNIKLIDGRTDLANKGTIESLRSDPKKYLTAWKEHFNHQEEKLIHNILMKFNMISLLDKTEKIIS